MKDKKTNSGYMDPHPVLLNQLNINTANVDQKSPNSNEMDMSQRETEMIGEERSVFSNCMMAPYDNRTYYQPEIMPDIVKQI